MSSEIGAGSEQSVSLPPVEYTNGQVVFTGRTGIGLPVEVIDVDGWLDVRYIDPEGEVRWFSLNGYFGATLARALVGVLAERAAPIGGTRS